VRNSDGCGAEQGETDRRNKDQYVEAQTERHANQGGGAYIGEHHDNRSSIEMLKEIIEMLKEMLILKKGHVSTKGITGAGRKVFRRSRRIRIFRSWSFLFCFYEQILEQLANEEEKKRFCLRTLDGRTAIPVWIITGDRCYGPSPIVSLAVANPAALTLC
jgi:hypothetical protein